MNFKVLGERKVCARKHHGIHLEWLRNVTDIFVPNQDLDHETSKYKTWMLITPFRSVLYIFVF
jgi:hypothetical protein